jgi:hypothetical protein
LIGWLLLFANAAFAGPGLDGIAAARESLVAGESERATMLLVQARLNLPKEPTVLEAGQVAELLYLEGLSPRVAGLEREQDVEKWRQALTVYPSMRWARDIMNDKALRGYFEALRSEVRQREPVPTGVPAKRGLIKAYVDGVEHATGQAVRSGVHLAQVECPGGIVRGQWTDFSDTVDWVGLCPGKVDLTEEPEVAEVDEFAMIQSSPLGGPEPLVWVEPMAPIVQRQPIKLEPRTLWIGAGVAGGAAAVTYAAALMARNKYDRVEPAALNSLSELEQQRSKTNALALTSAGLLGVSAVLSAGAVWGVEF